MENALDRGQLQDLLEERALAHDAMDASRVHRIREDMERAEARRLQPHYIESFFLEAFQRLGGSAKQREPRRYEVTHVPAPVRNRDRLIGIGEPVLPRYERIAFEKSLVAPPGQPLAAFVCPGHPLLDSVIDLTLERHRDLLKRGTVLVDERDAGTQPRVLFYSSTRSRMRASPARASAASSPSGCSTSSSTPTGTTRHLHYAPYLDYRPLAEGEPGVGGDPRPARVRMDRPRDSSRRRRATRSPMSCRSTSTRCATRKLKLIAKTEAAVKDRLTKEITYWDHRAEQLKLQEQAGKPNARLNSGEARKRADDLQGRLQKRLEELKLEAPDLAAAAGGARRAAGGARGPDRGHDGRTPAAPIGPRRHPGQRRAGARRSSWRSNATSASSRPTASSRSSATTSRAASPAPASCASSR